MQKIFVENKTFEKTDFTQDKLPAVDYEKCLFKNCNFSNGDLSNIHFTECIFNNCNLSVRKQAFDTAFINKKVRKLFPDF